MPQPHRRTKLHQPGGEENFSVGSTPPSPTSPTSPTISQVRVVFFHEMEDSQWMQVSNVCTDSEESEWVILDSGSDVSLLPSRFQPNSDFGLAP